MQTISDTDAQNQLAELIDAASRDREPIIITRNGASKVVLLAIEDYEAMDTTAYLLSTKANRDRLQQGLEEFAAGKSVTGELCD